MSYGTDFILTLFTNDVCLAEKADEAGINRIGLDLENIGKNDRQDQSKSWVSNHHISELNSIREAIRSAALFARTNPIHDESKSEINFLIQNGVKVIMLPMFRTIQEAQTFIDLVNGRAKVSLLVETAAAAARIRDLVKLDGIDEIHIGLNDLHLDLKVNNHFEVLASSLLDMLSEIIISAGIPFGFGGIARVEDERLPIPSELIYPQYPRLGADRALVSRVFYSPNYMELDLGKEVQRARREMDIWSNKSIEELETCRENLSNLVKKWNA